MGVGVVDGFGWIDVVKGVGVYFMKVDWFNILLILFGLFLAYQIILYLVGGSWQSEGLIIALSILNLGFLWKLSLKFEGHISWHKFRDGGK